MREILFRGKRIDNGEWVEGYYLVAAGMAFISAFGIREPIHVDGETVGQFTGLTDKNGKKIFEGDIVEIDNRRYTVSFEKGCWVILGKVGFWDFLQTNVKSCKVIGKVHDNPELLEMSNNE